MDTLKRNELHKALKEGATIHFDNEKFCEEFGSDDFRGGEISLRKNFGTMEFTTQFNGVINHTSKGFDSCFKNLNRLCEKFGCNVTNVEE